MVLRCLVHTFQIHPIGTHDLVAKTPSYSLIKISTNKRTGFNCMRDFSHAQNSFNQNAVCSCDTMILWCFVLILRIHSNRTPDLVVIAQAFHLKMLTIVY